MLRSDFGAGFVKPSDDGGFDEFREFAASWRSSSAIRASWRDVRLQPRDLLGLRNRQFGELLVRRPEHRTYCPA